MSEISDAINTNAQNPQSHTVDGESVTEHSLTEQIEADKYLQGQEQAQAPNFGLRYGRFRHQGTRW